MLDFSKYQARGVELSKISFDNKLFQYRVAISDEDVKGLAESIKEHGQEAPIVVWERSSGELVIICGYRRFTAIKLLGNKDITAIVIPEAELIYEQAVELSLDENIQRKSYMENDYLSICRKLSSEGKSVRQIGKMIEKGHSVVDNYLIVSKLPKEIQDAIRDGKLTISDTLKFLRNHPLTETGKDGCPLSGQGDDNPDVPSKISIENTIKLVEILKGTDCKEKLKKYINSSDNSYANINEIPGVLDRLKAIVSKRDNFLLNDTEPGVEENVNNSPAGRVGFKAKAGVIGLNISIDAAKDSLADLKRKAGFLKASALEVEKLARELEKANEQGIKARAKAKEKGKKKAGPGIVIPDKFEMSQEELQIMGKVQKKMTENLNISSAEQAGDAASNPFFAFGANQLKDAIQRMQQSLAMPGLSDADCAKVKEGIEKMQGMLNNLNKEAQDK